MVKKARALAEELHGLQTRKSNGLPYTVHLEETANIVTLFKGDNIAISAAWLHDSVEDQSIPVDLVDTEVFKVVMELTEDKDLSWEDRKQAVVDHIPHLSPRAALVKAADVLSNLRGVYIDGSNHPDFWSLFKRGRDKSLWFYHECIMGLAGHPAVPDELVDELWWRFERATVI